MFGWKRVSNAPGWIRPGGIAAFAFSETTGQASIPPNSHVVEKAVNSRGRQCDHRHSGYTLVELLLIVSIMGLAAAIVVPHMIRSGQLTIQAAGRAIIADILYAQNEAVANQEPRKVTFDVAGNRYRVTDAEDKTIGVSWKSGGSATQNYVVDFNRESRFAGVKLASVNFAGGTTLEFDDLGAPVNGGTIDLVFEDTRYRISVAPFTGRVTIDRVQ